MTEPELRERQAKIRDFQRDRIDDIHAEVHELFRDETRLDYGSLTVDSHQERRRHRLEHINELLHLFMRGYDDAVLVHEATALLRGEDAEHVRNTVARTLWPVRTERPGARAMELLNEP